MKLEVQAIMWYFGMGEQEAIEWRMEAYPGTIRAITALYMAVNED